jgi:ATP-dependent RNA helicase RhlE
MNFIELGLSEKTIKAINEAGITSPTTVQIDVIPSILAGKDVFTIAPSACGKTCSYVFPLIDIISRKQAQNILIITASPKQSVTVSDRFSVFNKYHEVNESTVIEEDDVDNEANVIIASPNLLLDLVAENKVDLSKINILVVDDINLIKKFHQLENLEKVLAILPADKQNIVFTNRRSKETQSILDKILQTPEEIKVNKEKEDEAVQASVCEENLESCVENTEKVIKTDKKSNKHERNNRSTRRENNRDSEAMSLMKKFRIFGRRTPEFLLTKVELADED